MSNGVVLLPERDEQVAALLDGRMCNICCDDLDSENYIVYNLGCSEPECLVTTMCGSCLDDLYQSQNEKVKRFVTDLSDLSQCSKLLKHLLRGEYGVPVNISDVVIFPSVDNRAVENCLDPEFGRKSEVYRLWVGQHRVQRDPHLSNGPKTREELREILQRVISRVRDKLRDYDKSGLLAEASDDDGLDDTIINEIRANLTKLSTRLAH